MGEISTEFARDTADISDRENVQYHWIEVEHIPEIWRRLAAVGLQTTEACGDCPRVVLGSPLAGESLDEVIDGPRRSTRSSLHRQAGVPNLPRKYKTAISACRTSPTRSTTSRSSASTTPSTARLRPVGRRRPVHQPDAGQRVGAWVPLDEVPDVWEAVTSVFRDYGYRRLRPRRG